jgi:predicted lipoprotein
MRTWLIAALLGASVFASCKRSSSPPTSTAPDSGSFDRAALLSAFGQCAHATYKDFDAAAADLEQKAARLAADPSAENRAAAREAWIKAIDIWQVAEIFQFGPAAMNSSPGGKELRDPIYAWPLFSRCLVDQTLVSKGYEAGDFATVSLVNTRALSAAEYLVFYEGTDNGCPDTATINTSGSWGQVTDLPARKAAYARVVTADVAARSRQLLEAWDPARGNFLGELSTAGRGSKLFSTDQLAFNAVSDGIFYLDHTTKDMKVARPAGLMECTTPTCPETVESRFARRSKVHIKNNLIGVRKMLIGCGEGGAGLGLDDLIEAVGAGELAARLRVDMNAAIAAAEAIDETDLDESVQTDRDSVLRLHAAMKKITDTLKTEVATVLDLELPKRVEGDND